MTPLPARSSLFRSTFSRGSVSLVGAGPGDPELLTLKALKRLQAADLVAYDRLVNPVLLRECRADAQLVYVGKHDLNQDDRALRPSWDQAAINALLVREARTGKRVVRLKGGDPFVFGRGGEEMLELARAGIPFEVVPGISSAVAAPAYAGIPVTHRHLASSFTVVAGHEDPTKEGSSHDWAALARLETLVVLMGVGRLEAILAELVRHGRPAATPAALVHWGTTAQQQTVSGTLADLAQKVRTAGITPPATLIVGEVVALQASLAWFEAEQLLLDEDLRPAVL